MSSEFFETPEEPGDKRFGPREDGFDGLFEHAGITPDGVAEHGDFGDELAHTAARDAADMPEFDVSKFEAEAEARAKLFAKHVKRLANYRKHELEDGEVESWDRAAGSVYALPDGRVVEVKHELWNGKSADYIAKLRITEAPIDVLGCEDGQLRRVTFSRSFYYKSFPDSERDIYGEDDEEPEDVETAPEIPETSEYAGRLVFGAIEAEQLEALLAFQPPELIWQRDERVIEVQMAGRLNFRTERADTLRSEIAQRSHSMAISKAALQAGWHPREYDLATHYEVMDLLASLKPAKGEPLSHDFDSSWYEPDVPENWWHPRHR